jgi:hypothetical protein
MVVPETHLSIKKKDKNYEIERRMTIQMNG